MSAEGAQLNAPTKIPFERRARRGGGERGDHAAPDEQELWFRVAENTMDNFLYAQAAAKR